MDIRDRRGLRQAAKAALERASYDPKKLILIHTAASVALSLILSVVAHLLQMGIDGTGGLGGIGTRAILETIHSALTLAQAVAILFWQIGFTCAALAISRGQQATPITLTEGFRRFGPVLRLRLITGMLYFSVLFVGIYLASTIFTFTPWAQPLTEAIQVGTEDALMAAMDEVMLPMSIVSIVVIAALLIPYHYRLRLIDYALLDDPRGSAMMAIRRSRMLMHKNRIALFRLDLSFWWFYALQFLTALVGYGDLILPAFGITLPWSATVSYYIFLLLCYGMQLLLYRWRGCDVEVAYAMAYQALLPKDSE